jgi:hypothetical protein
VIVVLLLTKITPSIKNKIEKVNTNRQLSVSELVGQDSNNNGIQDWEETLWGLDPKGDGSENKNFIINKKKSLNGGVLPADTTENLSDNDKMAREFFAMIISLQQSGNLNEEAIKNISNSVGANVVAEDLKDIYTKDMLNIQSTTTITLGSYQNAMQKIIRKYNGTDMGDELSFIGQAVAGNDPQVLKVGVSIANSYRSLGSDIMKVSVPSSLAGTHLELANNMEKTARSIENMGKLLDNPMQGMTAIVQYKRYNDALLANLEQIRIFFTKNGIISSN